MNSSLSTWKHVVKLTHRSNAITHSLFFSFVFSSVRNDGSMTTDGSWNMVSQPQPMYVSLSQAQPIDLREGSEVKKEKDKEKEDDKSSEGCKSSEGGISFLHLNDWVRLHEVKLVSRDTWDSRSKNHPENDADAYSRNGHPPCKLIKTGLHDLEIRDWHQTPCRNGAACKAHARDVYDAEKAPMQKQRFLRCWFLHNFEDEEIEVAAGSLLRIRQIKSSAEAFDGRYSEIQLPPPQCDELD